MKIQSLLIASFAVAILSCNNSSGESKTSTTDSSDKKENKVADDLFTRKKKPKPAVMKQVVAVLQDPYSRLLLFCQETFRILY